MNKAFLLNITLDYLKEVRSHVAGSAFKIGEDVVLTPDEQILVTHTEEMIKLYEKEVDGL